MESPSAGHGAVAGERERQAVGAERAVPLSGLGGVPGKAAQAPAARLPGGVQGAHPGGIPAAAVRGPGGGRERLALLLETICATGIRVSELRFVTVEAARRRRADAALKGKIRTILLPGKLCRKLLKYAGRNKTASGEVFLTRGGASLSRKQIWREMKGLCQRAGVEPSKVFPHNLRHLFASAFYRATRDIVKLADVLGHASITPPAFTCSPRGRSTPGSWNGWGWCVSGFGIVDKRWILSPLLTSKLPAPGQTGCIKTFFIDFIDGNRLITSHKPL